MFLLLSVTDPCTKNVVGKVIKFAWFLRKRFKTVPICRGIAETLHHYLTRKGWPFILWPAFPFQCKFDKIKEIGMAPFFSKFSRLWSWKLRLSICLKTSCTGHPLCTEACKRCKHVIIMYPKLHATNIHTTASLGTF